jgi:hypothetical protein
VATTTEIHDHLRVLWSRAGTPRCPTHGEALVASDAARIAKQVVKAHSGRKGWIVAPMIGAGAAESGFDRRHHLERKEIERRRAVEGDPANAGVRGLGDRRSACSLRRGTAGAGGGAGGGGDRF